MPMYTVLLPAHCNPTPLICLFILFICIFCGYCTAYVHSISINQLNIFLLVTYFCKAKLFQKQKLCIIFTYCILLLVHRSSQCSHGPCYRLCSSQYILHSDTCTCLGRYTESLYQQWYSEWKKEGGEGSENDIIYTNDTTAIGINKSCTLFLHAKPICSVKD